jgi:hypothetical protein
VAIAATTSAVVNAAIRCFFMVFFFTSSPENANTGELVSADSR